MAKIPTNDPNHWRRRAEEARTLADELTDPEAKRKMLKVADEIAPELTGHGLEAIGDDIVIILVPLT